jgi:hypothetical protein
MQSRVNLSLRLLGVVLIIRLILRSILSFLPYKCVLFIHVYIYYICIYIYIVKPTAGISQ